MHNQIMARNGLGAQLLRKVKSITAAGLDTLAKAHATARTAAPAFANVKPSDLALAKQVAERTLQQRDGLYGPAFAATRAARSHAFAKAATRAKPVTTAGKPAASVDTRAVPTMKAPSGDFAADLDMSNPLHVHAKQLRESADAHAALLESMKHALDPKRNQSAGPEAL